MPKRKYQEATAEQLKNKLKKRNYWLRIHSNKLLAKVQTEDPAKIIEGGISKIVSYYDKHLSYICTMHIVVTKDGSIIHEHVKDAYLDGIRYKSK